MKKCFLSTLVFLSFVIRASTQDSLHYSILWTPDYQYFKTGTKGEGIFLYHFRKNKIVDSLLVQTKAYDSLGRLVRQQNFFYNRLRSRMNHYYAGSRLDSSVQEETWLSATVVHRYTYDSTGNLILEQTFNNNQQTTQTRYVYNAYNQLLQLFTTVGNNKEILTTRYTYRPDRLVQQVDYYFPQDPYNNYSFLYTYAPNDRTVTRFFQRSNDSKRFIDYIRTYNNRGQLTEEIVPPLPQRGWRPPGSHSRPEEEKRYYKFYENGLLLEKEATIDNQTIWIEKHVYL